jgi:uncharacterized membrane protein YcaP (DUF421 family)
LAGLATLAAVLGSHWALSSLRQFPSVASLLDQPPCLVVADGQVLKDGLRRCALTQDDLYGLLRRQGLGELSDIRYAILEPRGQLSVIRCGTTEAAPTLVRSALTATTA